MKRERINFLYLSFLIFGLIWIISCTKSPGGSVNVQTYNLSIEMQPNPVYADTGEGVLNCFLTVASEIVEDEWVYFRCTSSEVSAANISAAAKTSASSPTGTDTPVEYNLVDYTGLVDTIYAVYYSTYPTDTLTWAMTTVDIIYPVLNMNVTISPVTVYSDTGRGLINCFVTSDGIRIDDQKLQFRAVSSSSSNSIVTPLRAVSSANTASGTTVPVYYYPNNYAGFTDTVYVVWLDDQEIDTLKQSILTVDIIHP